MEISSSAKFLAKQILSGKLTYEDVISKRPDLKEQIDEYMTETAS